MGERMDGWPLTWRREGRAGWREVVLEMEEKKRGDINLAEGMSLSLSVSLSLKTHTYVPSEMQAAALLTHFLSVSSGPLSPVRSRTQKSECLSLLAAPSENKITKIK